ncbi:MAG: aspartate--tRNA ligase [Planctomycetota bacterium]|nr:MAG: aspartate--tRNA ligase [Planctomycetota bacterium]
MAIAYNRRTHYCGEIRSEHVDQPATLAGWVHSTRDHGGVIFVDLRDHTGLVQLRFRPEQTDVYELARSLHHEDVLAVMGRIVRRESVNPKIPTGEVEIDVSAMEVLSRAAPLPFPINEEFDAAEELCLRYRFLHLRRPEMQNIFRLRHRIARAIREYFHENGFVEIETPFLTKSTPEGARDYLVPSRVKPGSFYALPQSPQIFKQLFMIAGFDRYAQIVRCFRDEDLRADRQPEFTQLDMEMAFVKRDEVMTMVEGCVQRIFRDGLGIDVKTPFPRMSEAEAVERFGIDRPDTRFGMELQDVTDLAGRTSFQVFRGAIDAGGVVKCLVAKKAESLTRKKLDTLTEEVKGIGGTGMPYVKVVAGESGPAASTGIAKFVGDVFPALCERTNAEPGDLIVFMPGTKTDVAKYLHYVRTWLARELDLIPKDRWNLLWVVDFPLFEWDEETQRWASIHHPFTAPLEEDLPLLDTDPGKVRAQAYDLVLNGTEMAGGSIRIHRQDVQRKVFSLLGLSEEEAREKFAFLLDALQYGAPPHGGIAFGFDRWAMMLAGAESLREVIAFPKTQRAVCPLTGAPAPVAQEQLDELHLALKKPAK